ncbi:MAG TPA: OmpA family protein [Methyloceanibacter sp.]|nr:OmpA family protein [Methyloceanibacter sp.]
MSCCKVPRYATVVAALALASMLTLGNAGASDIPGSGDHPLVGRYQGAEIVGYSIKEYDETTVIDGAFAPEHSMDRTGNGFRTVEGKIFLIYYKLPQGRSSLEVLRNYQDSLKAKGFTIMFACATGDGTCFENHQPDSGYQLGYAIGDPNALPKLSDDYPHNWFAQQGRYLLARLDRPEGAVYVALYLGETDNGNVAVVKVVETKEMESDKIQFVNASQMEQAIAQSGKVALYGILFDFDKDVVKPESKPTLDEIAKLMQGKPDLKLKVVGHTDNQGTADYNLDLSRRRAANVVAALTTGYGIAADRLTAEGAGLTQPIAPNDTEEGRAKNRRVELVAQ